MDVQTMQTAMGANTSAPATPGKQLTLDQMNTIMNGGTPDHTQAAQVFGASNNILMKLAGGALDLGKEVANNLVVTPATRVGQAAGYGIAKAAGATPEQLDKGLKADYTLPGTGINVPEQKKFGEGGATQIGKGAVETASLLAPLGKIVEPVFRGVKALGGGIGKMFLPKSEAEAGMLQAYKAGTSLTERVGNLLGYGSGKAPSTAASTAFEKGLVGTESMLGVQAKRAQGKIWNKLVAPALKQSTEKVDMPNFFQTAADQISKTTNDPTREKMLQNALASVKEDFGKIGDVSMEQLQKYKEGWAKFVPEKSYKGQPIAGALNEVRSVLADAARQHIYESLGDEVKQAYLDYGNLDGITKLGQKAMAGSGFKGGAGQLAHTLWEMATVPVGTIAGQTVYKVGQIGEFVGEPGAKTLGGLLGIQFGKSGQSDPSQPESAPSQ